MCCFDYFDQLIYDLRHINILVFMFAIIMGIVIWRELINEN